MGLEQLAMPQAIFTPVQATGVAGLRSILRNQVAEILGKNIPSLRNVPRVEIYDRVLDDPQLLHEAFQLLRNKPEVFSHLLKTEDAHMPHSDHVPLACGMNLGEVVTVVLRASARRYFHRRLSGTKGRIRREQGASLWNEFLTAWGLRDVETAKVLPKKLTPGDTLYRSMREFLLFDWQALMIPAYAQLPATTAKKLGKEILAHRDPISIVKLAKSSNIEILPRNGLKPLLEDQANRLFAAGTDTLNPDMLWKAFQQMDGKALYSGLDAAEIRRAIATIAMTNPVVIKTLMPVLGKSAHHFALFLFVTYATWGPIRYRQSFGANTQSWMIEALARRIKSEPPLSGEQIHMQARIVKWLDGAINELEEKK